MASTMTKDSESGGMARQQARLAFHLTGTCAGTGLEPIGNLKLRPALLARYRHLSELRYDFPLVLADAPTPSESLLSLSHAMDCAVEKASKSAKDERLARHAQRIEREIRKLSSSGDGPLFALFEKAVERLSKKSDAGFQESAARLQVALDVHGEVVECGHQTLAKVFLHLWSSVQRAKSKRLEGTLERLILKLSDLLRSDDLHTEKGRSAQSLRGSFGSTFESAFDFDEMSRLIGHSKSEATLPYSRRRRIERTLEVLRSQRFIATDRSDSQPFSFTFESPEDAVEAYWERLPAAVEFAKAMNVARLEIEGEYSEGWHEAVFENFGANGLDPVDAEALPDYFVWVSADRLLPHEMQCLAEAVSMGLPIKVLLQTDDLLGAVSPRETHPTFGTPARQITSTAIALGDVFVLQCSASHLYPFRDRMIRGLNGHGAAVFSIYSGAGGQHKTIPPYLVAAAAMESRAFPSFVYDPSAGKSWAERFHIEDNPQAENDWPSYLLEFEDEEIQRSSERTAFTFVDLALCDARWSKHFAKTAPNGCDEFLVPVDGFVVSSAATDSQSVPYVFAADENDALQRLIVDDALLRESARCLDMWRSLQELGGIHNSHAKKQLDEARNEWESQTVSQPTAPPNSPTEHVSPIGPISPIGPTILTEPPTPEPAEEKNTDDPFIETPRCTTCNECTQINNKMFAYNDNKQAYIKDPDAGTYRQLVEAAESCQVGIIHPGKPRNPTEPGLDELLKRAEPFL